jgi:hypothetical protein
MLPVCTTIMMFKFFGKEGALYMLLQIRQLLGRWRTTSVCVTLSRLAFTYEHIVYI